MQGNDQANTLAGKVTLRSNLLLGRSEVLRSLRHYLRAHSQGHHSIDHCVEELETLPAGTKPRTILHRSHVLRSLRHYLRAQSQGHHSIDRLEERGVERGGARRSSLKGRERAIVSRTNIGTVSKATPAHSPHVLMTAFI